MDKYIENALFTIEEDYKTCLRIVGRYFDYLETCGLREFNRFSKYKWSYDRDRSNGFSYVCIRYGSSLKRRCLVKRRAYIENDELYKWVENKELVEEALDEAYQYIMGKITVVKSKIEAMRALAVNFEERLDEVVGDYDEMKVANKRLVDGEWEEVRQQTIDSK